MESLLQDAVYWKTSFWFSPAISQKMASVSTAKRRILIKNQLFPPWIIFPPNRIASALKGYKIEATMKKSRKCRLSTYSRTQKRDKERKHLPQAQLPTVLPLLRRLGTRVRPDKGEMVVRTAWDEVGANDECKDWQAQMTTEWVLTKVGWFLGRSDVRQAPMMSYCAAGAVAGYRLKAQQLATPHP